MSGKHAEDETIRRERKCLAAPQKKGEITPTRSDIHIYMYGFFFRDIIYTRSIHSINIRIDVDPIFDLPCEFLQRFWS